MTLFAATFFGLKRALALSGRCIRWIFGSILWPYMRAYHGARRIAPWALAAFLLHSAYWSLRWQFYRHSAIGRGVTLDLPTPPPSPIADSLNFAAADGPFAPHFQKAAADEQYARWLDLSGINLLAFPDLDKGKRATIEESYIQAALSSPPIDKNAPRTAADFIRFFDRKYATEWPAVLAAEAKSEARFPIAPAMEDGTSVPYPQLRRAAQLHCLRAMALLELGRHEEARDEIHGALRLVHVLQNSGDPDFSSYMISIAFSGIVVEPLWEGLVDQRWSAADLAALQEELSALHPEAGWTAAVDHERAWENSVFDELASVSPQRRYKALEQRRSDLRKDGNAALFWLAGLSNGLIRENQLVANEAADQARHAISSEGLWRPNPSSPQDLDHRRERSKDVLADLVAVPYSRSACRVAGIITRLRQASVAIALERYRLQTGELPERLDTLAPRLMPEIPRDPVTGDPIRYVRESEQTYRLLCASSNGVPGILQPRDTMYVPSDNGPDFIWHGLAPEASRTAMAAR
ncbi:MAG TPA: hypothetical protein VGH90_06145 [Chthoniobacteraceae bacterium]